MYIVTSAGNVTKIFTAELVEMNCQEEEMNKLQSELTEIDSKLLTATKKLTGEYINSLV